MRIFFSKYHPWEKWYICLHEWLILMVNDGKCRDIYHFSHGCYGSYGFGPTVFPQKLRIIKSHLKWCGRGISQCFRPDW